MQDFEDAVADLVLGRGTGEHWWSIENADEDRDKLLHEEDICRALTPVFEAIADAVEGFDLSLRVCRIYVSEMIDRPMRGLAIPELASWRRASRASRLRSAMARWRRLNAPEGVTSCVLLHHVLRLVIQQAWYCLEQCSRPAQRIYGSARLEPQSSNS